MTKSRRLKRKRHDISSQTQKRVALAIPPPLDWQANNEPISLSSIISREEIEISVDTLSVLSQHPELIKSKLCKDLRAAVYDFRQACTVGSVSACGSSLTGRITGALTDGKLLEARVLLAEMRIRGDEPKLGSLCRWIRDLDFISGLSTQGKGAADAKLLSTLDAILRVSCPIDTNEGAVKDNHSPVTLQSTWNVTPSTESEAVYESVLNQSIFTIKRSSLRSKLRIVETVEGPARQPPNRYPAVIYTTIPQTVALSPNHPSPSYQQHPHVPGLGLVLNVLTPSECKSIIAAGESVEFLPDAPMSQCEDASVLAHNFYWVVDQEFHDRLWTRISPCVPAMVGGRRARCLNRRFRVYRYVHGAEYRCHIDGAWPPSGISDDDRYVYDDSPPTKKQSSLFTFLLYLNDEFEGGETTFFLPAQQEGCINAYPVRPVMGGAAIFPHGEARGALLHEGTGVRTGAKYVIRTDVEYDVEPS